jgi:membrane peptidoglycan carboxypeptidase
MGISAPLPEVPSLALGSAEIPLYQMVQAYSLFLNEGRTRQLRFIEKILDAEGNVIYEPPENTTSDTCFLKDDGPDCPGHVNGGGKPWYSFRLEIKL